MALLDSSFLTRLDRLSLSVRHVRAGQTAGERRSTKRGASVEFADYRDYVRGDDLRRVDWNLYARLERPFVKLFEEEEDLAVHVLLDGSGSMDWGGEMPGRTEEPGRGDEGTGGRDDRATNKWLYARRLAAALGYVALTSGDRLQAASLRRADSEANQAAGRHIDRQAGDRFGPARGRSHALRYLAWLEGLEAGGTTDLNAALHAYAATGARAGLVILISDLFSPLGFGEGLTALAGRGHEVTVVHLLSPDEVEPPLGGDLRLLDVETGGAQEVTVDGGTRALYRRRLAAWQDEVRRACRGRDARYAFATTDVPVDRVVLYGLRSSGLLK
jgi:uncharacterized protein (DUF58 family)